jgi:hypothetical protein
MANQMYVYADLCVSEQRMHDEISNLGEALPDAKLLLMVDYVYHHQDDDYDGGLSFLDRIQRKIGMFKNWDIQNFKDTIRNANDKQAEYLRVINQMFHDTRDIMCYGL